MATWFWTVSDTGNGDGIVEPGESALLELWLSFEPRQDQTGGGFAQAGLYDILGNGAWAQGTLDERIQMMTDSMSDGALDEHNNILDLDHFQYPIFFDGAFKKDNPVQLFIIRWTPDAYFPRTVTLDNGAPAANIYVDAYGGTVPYTGTGGFVAFSVVPAPGAATLLMCAALAAARRRR